MKRACRSLHSPARANFARIAAGVLLAIATPSRADDLPGAQIVVVPSECVQFWSIAGGSSSPTAWDGILSFAACIQDGSVSRVERAGQLEAFVEELQRGLGPSLHFYLTAIKEGPAPIRLRAAYYVGLGQVALMTRARASLASPDLRRHLEPLLEPHAKLAYVMFASIDRAAATEPALTPDPVNRSMVRSARELAAVLRKTLTSPTGEDAPLLALPR
jgi:hypothetical protein